MKRFFLFSVLLILGTTLTVNGQDLQGMFSLSPFAGIGLPMGDMANDDVPEVTEGDALYRKTGFKFGAEIDYFFTPNLGIGIDFKYATFSAKDIIYEGVTYTTDDKLKLMMFGAHAKYMFIPDGTVRPYGVLGGGLVISKLKDWDYFENLEYEADLDFDTKPYLIFGGGVTYFVSPTVSVFGELTIDYLMLDGAGIELDGQPVYEDGNQVEVETNYYFLDFMVGLSIWFGGD